MRDQDQKPFRENSFLLITAVCLIEIVTFIACATETPQKEKTPNKLPTLNHHSAADFADDYETYTVLVDSFDVANKAEAYYLAGQLRAVRIRCFVLRRPNQTLYVCVGNNKTKQQAEDISEDLNNEFELASVVIKLETKSPK